MLFQSSGYLTLAAAGLGFQRMGNEFTFSVPTNTYRCGDGGIVMLGVLLDTHWKVLARMIGRADLADDRGFATLSGHAKNRAQCNAMVAEWCAVRTRAEVVETCAQNAIPCEPVNSYEEAARDPHVLARDMLQPMRQENGAVLPITGPAAKFSRTPIRVRTAAPALGAHTDEILDELGMKAAERAQLRASRVI